MSDLTIAAGDYGTPLGFTVLDYTGAVVNLTGYTVKLKVWYKGASANPIVSGTCTLDSAPSGTCHYTPIITDFPSARAGDYIAELQLEKVGVIESTAYFTLTVEESA